MKDEYLYSMLKSCVVTTRVIVMDFSSGRFDSGPALQWGCDFYFLSQLVIKDCCSSVLPLGFLVKVNRSNCSLMTHVAKLRLPSFPKF